MRQLTLFLMCMVTLTQAVAMAPKQEPRLTIRHYKYMRLSENRVSFLLNLKGMLDAFSSANGALIVQGQKPLYCQNPTVVLSEREGERILVAELEVTERRPNAALSLALLDGLKKAFPCTGPESYFIR